MGMSSGHDDVLIGLALVPVAVTMAQTYGHVQGEMRKPARDDMKRLFGGVSRGYWGRDEKPALRIMHKAGILGRVGQESNLHPAVVEPAAVRSATFRDVHEHP